MAWRLPAEWEPQEAIWLVWPRDPATWPDRLDQARRAIASAIEGLAPQQVHLIVHPASESPGPWPHVTQHSIEHVDSWIRDYGPLTVVDGGRARHVKFRFDAWGEKYPTLMEDDHVVPRLVKAGLLSQVELYDEVLEGGAVETDGQGTFLATASVAAARDQSRQEHQRLLERLGAKQVIWLEEGIQGDDTDGHIDTIARFVAPGVVVVASAPEGHPDHAALAANLEALQRAMDAKGRRLQVVTLPPAPVLTTDDGSPLPAGYANFLIANEAVLVPAFGVPEDRAACEILGQLFPGRRMVAIDHRDLIWGFGGIHCLSMQVAAAGT